jgi:3-dehydroquinate synthetase
MKNNIDLTAKFENNFHTHVVVDSIDNLPAQNVFFVIDSFFKDYFSQKLLHQNVFWLDASEVNKDMSIVTKILYRLSASNLTRHDTIIAIGGGITLDIASFCASIYKRGCGLILYPTTIIGMIDAAIGGKTGVNLGNIKNQLGSFYPAQKVVLDYESLKTLPDIEVKNGFAELIKMMVLFYRQFFTQDFSYISKHLHEYIFHTIRYKIDICSSDLRDTGERRLLNLGHTFAHLFETISDYRIPHGMAVASGLRLALQLSVEKGICPIGLADKVNVYLGEFCSKLELSNAQRARLKVDGATILSKDKKADKHVKLVLINEVACEMHDVEDVKALIDWIAGNI